MTRPFELLCISTSAILGLLLVLWGVVLVSLLAISSYFQASAPIGKLPGE